MLGLVDRIGKWMQTPRCEISWCPRRHAKLLRLMVVYSGMPDDNEPNPFACIGHRRKLRRKGPA